MTLIFIVAFLTWLYWVLRLTWFLIEVAFFWDDYYFRLTDWWRMRYGLREDV